MKWTKRLAVSGLMVMVLLVLMEVLLRHWGTFRTYSEINRGEFISPYQEHSARVFANEPCLRYEFGNEEYQYSASNNEFGIRDRERDVLRNKDCRIVFLGDSFVEGAGAPSDSTWPHLLEARLQTVSGDSMEIISGGVGGSDPVFYHHLYDQWLEVFDPDVVLAAVNQSDFEDYLIRGGTERFTGHGLEYRNPPVPLFLYQNSFLYRAYVHLVEKRDGYLITPGNRRELLRECLDEYESLFTEWHGEMLHDGISLVVVIYPVPGDFLYEERFGRTLYVAEMDSLYRRLLEAGIPCMNLTDCMYGSVQEYGGKDGLYWPMDMHYNSTGYNLLADCSAEALLAFFEFP